MEPPAKDKLSAVVAITAKSHYLEINTTHGMPCNFTACLGPVGLALETVAEVADDEAFPVSFFRT